jgi:hypothetical protein
MNQVYVVVPRVRNSWVLLINNDGTGTEEQDLKFTLSKLPYRQ